ncbi:MAG TPA: tetratricopeptide repeat protein [Blastocatellia bacterium]|nr:tetratricopeptide repeat protein [Blastocatellia bacterium]
MVIDLSLKNPIARAVVLLASVGVAVLLVIIIFSKFIVGTMTDNRKQFSSNELASPVYHFPNSARLHARLAEAEMFDRDRDLALAESHALMAIKLSPHDFRYPLILASVKEAGGDRQAAGDQLRKALALAPNNQAVRYRLANLLLREGRLEESVEEFRVAVASETKLLASTIDLIWQASGNDVNLIERVAGENAKAQMTLALFLASRPRAEDAARVFSRIDRSVRLTSAETPLFFKSLIDSGHTIVARELWVGLWSAREPENTLVWNGSFETDISKNLGQFDWAILGKESKYARLGIDRTTARTGARALRIEFAGENTTRLDGEIKQLIALKPGARYRLECYAKSEGLVTPEGPRLVVTGGVSANDPKQEPVSEPVAAGSTDWQRLAVDFIAPQTKTPGQSSVVISIKRIPKFSYDEPTKGTVWFDDFTIKEQGPGI